jgi:hypothetical protein
MSGFISGFMLGVLGRTGGGAPNLGDGRSGEAMATADGRPAGQTAMGSWQRLAQAATGEGAAGRRRQERPRGGSGQAASQRRASPRRVVGTRGVMPREYATALRRLWPCACAAARARVRVASWTLGCRPPGWRRRGGSVAACVWMWSVLTRVGVAPPGCGVPARVGLPACGCGWLEPVISD